MAKATRNRLLALGALWGVLLAAVPAFVMGNPARPGGFAVSAVLCAAVSGAVGTLVAGYRASARRGGAKRGGVPAAFGAGLAQGFVGGGMAAVAIWALMAAAISGFSLENAADPSALMRPQVFIGGFFVALSVFLYALAGSLLLAPAFGMLINRTVEHPADRISEPEVTS